ncbi:hypothetical protein C8F04DRAFT_1099655 [Mycena alexandri]|uniref:Uncharacterized protein n=1 Tax=Mycena alexandri TaxID=1745969 RepID=A0AAD6X7G6_9AGAR|nr:hypothetical protein C8F04DRAFT_1099655 [Mycena alexandri]
MAHHLRNLHKRQDPGVIPSAAGIGGAATAAQAGEATAATLALDGAPAADPTNQVINFSVSVTGTVATPPPSTPTDNSNSTDDSTPSPSSTAIASSGSSEISLGTVIGACVGALAGAILIILVGLWLYKRGNKPRPRSPSNARKAPADKERAWGKMEEDDEDRWEGKDGQARQKEVHSVGPMEKLTMFKKSTPSMRTTYTNTLESEPLPPVHFDHPFAQYHPNLAKELAEDNGDLGRPPQRPFLARVEVAPISWDGDTVGRDSFLSLGSNNAMSPGTDLALPTPKLTSSEPHRWESAEVMSYDDNGDALPRGRAPVVAAQELRKSSHNPFFGASARMSTHSTRSRSQSRSRTPSFSSPSKTSLPEADPAMMPMPAPPPIAFTREEKGKYRAATPPSPTSSMAPSTVTGHGGVSFSSNNPFSNAHASNVPAFKPEHISNDSHDRALASLIAALGPAASVTDVQERLRVASMNPSVMSAYTEASEYAEDAMRESWPVPPSRPSPDSH